MRSMSGTTLILSVSKKILPIAATASLALSGCHPGSPLRSPPLALAASPRSPVQPFAPARTSAASSQEFTVASYNVENLFDQADDPQNSGYTDYRIAPTADGRYSNYGEPVTFNGVSTTFTAVKIAGIRQALLGIDPQGPAVVGLVEVESDRALQQLFAGVADLGYQAAQFTEWPANEEPRAVGLGLLSKFPLNSWSLIFPSGGDDSDFEAPRPILNAELDVAGHALTVYVNHWKSKSGPESQRKLSAAAVEADIEAMLERDPHADFIVMGDLNSNYNEAATLENGHNDTGGTTGINTVLRAQGDEQAVATGRDLTLMYNLHYELPRAARQTAWHAGFGWSSMDHLIISSGLYDGRGVTYVDNSFKIPTPAMANLSFLFKNDGKTNRWRQKREHDGFTRHFVGGYSDHLPVFARFKLAADGAVPGRLVRPGVPDAEDTAP